jgi:hypothetical protein
MQAYAAHRGLHRRCQTGDLCGLAVLARTNVSDSAAERQGAPDITGVVRGLPCGVRAANEQGCHVQRPVMLNGRAGHLPRVRSASLRRARCLAAGCAPTVWLVQVRRGLTEKLPARRRAKTTRTANSRRLRGKAPVCLRVRLR